MSWVTILFSAALAGDSSSYYVLCKLRETVRTIRIESSDTGCRVIYTKNGQDQLVATNKILASCHKVAENIQTNLKNAGWGCRDFSGQSKVVSSPSDSSPSNDRTISGQ